jgi:hypothetical protein
VTTRGDERQMDALEFVGRLYRDAMRFARRYEYGTEQRRFAEWLMTYLAWRQPNDPTRRD